MEYFIDLDSNYIEIFIILSNSLRCETKSISNKKIIKLISSIKKLCFKVHDQENEKRAHRMGKYIFKSGIW